MNIYNYDSSRRDLLQHPLLMDYVESISLFDHYGNRKYLNEDERQRFFAILSNQKQTDRVLFALMVYYTGARPSEVLNIKVSHIDNYDQLVRIKCYKKRGKLVFRHIPLPKAFLAILKRFIHDNNKNQDDHLWTFCYRTGYRFVKRIMIKANIPQGPQCTLKGLRHGFAVACVMRNIPISLLQRWMGHSSADVTAVYLTVVGKEERIFAQRLWNGEV